MIKIGDKLPAVSLKLAPLQGDFQEINSHKLCAGKKTIFFALPGAFTPVCSSTHVPGFLKNLDKIKEKGIAQIACISVNDTFVMRAWAKDLQTNDKIIMIADGACEFTDKLGLSFDIPGMGKRSKRYSMIVDDNVITQLLIENSASVCDLSSANYILNNL